MLTQIQSREQKILSIDGYASYPKGFDSMEELYGGLRISEGMVLHGNMAYWIIW